MATVFTEFVRQMDGGHPDPELCEHLWQALRGLLRVEMQRRSAWQTRPSFLGVIGHRSWAEPGDGSDGLDELVSDCFEHIFVIRLEGLRMQAQRKPSIDGLVLMAVRQFLLATQSRNDPLGFRVFEVLQGAMQEAVDRGQLVIIQGGPRIRNGTHLALEPGTPPEAVQRVDSSLLVQQWVDRRLDALVNASHQRLAKLKQNLVKDLLAFLGPQRPGVRFGDVAAPLKDLVRRNWAARFLNMPGFMAWRDEETPVPSAAEALTLRQHVAAVVRCLDRSEERDLDAKTRQYLSWLWAYLKGFAFEDLKRFVAGLVERSAVQGESDPDIFPTGRQLEALLGIPRARLPKLFERLQEQWQRCAERVGLPNKEGAMASSSRANPFPDAKSRAMASLQRALEASAADDGRQLKPGQVPATSLVPGDLFIVPWAEVDGVLWSVLAVNVDAGSVDICPTDQFPLLAATDLDLAWEDAEAEPRVVRLGLEASVPLAALGEVEACGRLSAKGLAAVLAHRAAVDPSTQDPSTQDLASQLPAYLEWLEDGPGRARRLLLAGRGGVEASQPVTTPVTTPTPFERPVPPRRRAARWPALANAAVLLLSLGLSAGLGWKVVELGRHVAFLEQPIVDLPYEEIQIGMTPRGTREIKVPPGALRVQLNMVISDLPEYPQYRFDLVAETGELLFQTPPFVYAREKSITLPVRMLVSGSVDVHLVGLRGGQEEILATEHLAKVEVMDELDPL